MVQVNISMKKNHEFSKDCSWTATRELLFAIECENLLGCTVHTAYLLQRIDLDFLFTKEGWTEWTKNILQNIPITNKNIFHLTSLGIRSIL